MEGGEARFKVDGDSMELTLFSGDILSVKHIPEQDIKVVDVIVARNRDTLVTHRLIEKGEEFWLTKGDNRDKPDLPFPPLSVLGIVTNVENE